jgi:hypothetical protein
MTQDSGLIRTESISEKYRLRRIWTFQFMGWGVGVGVADFNRDTLDCGVYAIRIQSTVHPPLTHLPFTAADNSQPYSDNFGNFLRRIAFALASTVVELANDYVSVTKMKQR